VLEPFAAILLIQSSPLALGALGCARGLAITQCGQNACYARFPQGWKKMVNDHPTAEYPLV
jgi:hypothetical protein